MCLICTDEYHGRLQRLEVLWCVGCTSLTQIPVIPGLKELSCGGCTSLTQIPMIPGLEELWCNGCTNLTQIPVIPGLKYLSCKGCTNLTQIPVIPGLKELLCDGCPWIEQNPSFQDNLSRLVILQLYVKKYHRLRLLKRYITTEDFTMWYYHPEMPGGLRQVKKIMKTARNV